MCQIMSEPMEEKIQWHRDEIVLLRFGPPSFQIWQSSDQPDFGQVAVGHLLSKFRTRLQNLPAIFIGPIYIYLLSKKKKASTLIPQEISRDQRKNQCISQRVKGGGKRQLQNKIGDCHTTDYANQEGKKCGAAKQKMYRVVVNNRSQKIERLTREWRRLPRWLEKSEYERGEENGTKLEQYKKGDVEIESQNAHRCRYTPDGHVVHTVIQKDIQHLVYTLGDYRRTTPKAREVRGNGTNQ